VTRLANGEESESLGADSYGGSREQETEAKRKLETGARNLRRWKPDQIKSGLQQDPRRANLRCGKNETLHQGGRTKNRPLARTKTVALLLTVRSKSRWPPGKQEINQVANEETKSAAKPRRLRQQPNLATESRNRREKRICTPENITSG
jgi:hypothetical protein